MILLGLALIVIAVFGAGIIGGIHAAIFTAWGAVVATWVSFVVTGALGNGDRTR